MKKKTTTVTKAYYYEPVGHRGAPYSFNGSNWFNTGELIECLYKDSIGLKATKDASGRFDICDDVPETGESVKSSKATLTTVKLGNSFEEVKANYFKRVHSNAWVWGILKDNELITYHMNRAEFESFMIEFSGLTQQKVIRFRTSSDKMVRWLEERVES